MSAAGHHAHEKPGPEGRFDGASIPEQPYRDDDGTTPAAVAEALDHFARTGEVAPVVTALLESRLLVGLVAVLDSVDGQGSEKDSHMAAAMIERPDGRRALMAFTSAAALRCWHPDARPLPVGAVDVARAAIEDDADTVVVDNICGITGAYLWALAERRRPVPPVTDDQVREAITALAAQVLRAAELPTGCRLTRGETDQDLVLLLDRAVVADPAAVARLAEALGADPVLRRRLPRGLSIGVEG